MDWRVKGAIQKLLCVVPGGKRLNSRLQLRVGGLRRFESNVDTKVVNDWLVLVNHMRELAIPIQGRSFIEMGTGWYPTLPVCYAIAGAARCYTYDLNRLMDWPLTRRMLARLEQHLPRIATALNEDERVLRDRWAEFNASPTLDALLQRAGIEYLAPADVTRTQLAAGSIDVVFSNSVLEHVPPLIIGAFMEETRRVLKSGGVAIHSVNCGDHYTYFDPTVTQINYLRYSKAMWGLWNNDLQYQNRLRADDFLDCARRAGLNVILNLQRPRPELLKDFDYDRVAPEFRRYSREQLCTTSIDFVARAET
ncbi:MAG: methyltransferase domain-containing protein [Pseudomonadota bacterium]